MTSCVVSVSCGWGLLAASRESVGSITSSCQLPSFCCDPSPNTLCLCGCPALTTSTTNQVVGPRPLEIISRWMNSITGNAVPVWNPYLPKGAAPVKTPTSSTQASSTPTTTARSVPRQVVYLPSCVTRMMGPAGGDYETASVHEKLMSLFDKAGYEVRKRGR